MAVAGLRIQLPGYQQVVPLAQLGTGSYLPSVALVTVGTRLLLQGVVLLTGVARLSFGFMAALGITGTYLLISLPVVTLGNWVQQYLIPLQLLAGPLISALGVLYYTDTTLPTVVHLPKRTDRSPAVFFSFGVLYGLGSLACNLPLFLGVILSVFATDGVIEGLAVFGAFAAGMSTLMIGVSVLTAATGRSYSLGRYTRRVRTLGTSRSSFLAGTSRGIRSPRLGTCSAVQSSVSVCVGRCDRGHGRLVPVIQICRSYSLADRLYKAALRRHTIQTYPCIAHRWLV